MNEHVRSHSLAPTTQAAEGLPRRRWTTAELLRMSELGLFRDALGNEERFELIGGEVVPMPPKGNRHEILRQAISARFSRAAPPEVSLAQEPQLNLADDLYTHPDILLYPEPILVPFVRGPDALLVIEVSETSLPYDLETKARIYAAHAVRDYWVISAKTLETRVFRNPAADGYPDPTIHNGEEQLAPLLIPALAIRLADLRLE